MSRKKLALLCAALLVALAAPPAHATVFSGACAMSLTFSFDSPVTAVPRAVSYSVTGGSARTVNQVTPGCVTDTTPLSPLRSTSASGGGHAVLWSCNETAAVGAWQQSWNPDPPPMEGSHTLAGTWGDWTMVVNSTTLNFVGEIELTVDPLDAGKLSQCTTSGISSLRMIGVMHFQDPSL